jgi:hypothetical protein
LRSVSTTTNGGLLEESQDSKSGGSLDIRSNDMSANNLTMNIGKFDGANYNKWSGQFELLFES